MKEIKAILFDFDGVIVDTEPQYDKFSNQLAEKYNLPDNFALLCRGVTLDYIFDNFFPDFSDSERLKIKDESDRYELKMEFPWVTGIQDFLDWIKTSKYRVGLITSSSRIKMDIALKKLNLQNYFEIEVTADDIVKGKPDPSCYLLGAKKLGVNPEECLVFEDSLLGLQAATSANMKAVGVATSFLIDDLKTKTENIIADFSDLELVKSFLK